MQLHPNVDKQLTMVTQNLFETITCYTVDFMPLTMFLLFIAVQPSKQRNSSLQVRLF